MKVNEVIYFWPGRLNSSLIYLLYDEESGEIHESCVSELPMFFAQNNDQQFYVGQRAVDVASVYPQSYLSQLLTEDSHRLSGADMVDVLGLSIHFLLTKLINDIRQQFKLEISSEARIKILNFDDMFAGLERQIVNVLPVYLGRHVDIADCDSAIKELVRHSPNKWVFCDDGVEKDSGWKDSVSVYSFFADIKEIVQKLLFGAKQTNQKLSSIINLLLKSKQTLSNDWYEVENGEVTDLVRSASIIDKYHLLRNVREQALTERISNEDASTLNFVGAFSNLVSRAVDEKKVSRENLYTRERFIRHLVSKGIELQTNQSQMNDTLRVQINSEEACEIKFVNRLSVLGYTLKLFGRSSEKIALSIGEGNDTFIKWNFEVKLKNVIDIYEITFNFLELPCGSIDCILDSTDELMVLVKTVTPMSEEKVRPIDKLINIAKAS